VLFRKPPYAAPERLVTLRQRFPKLGDSSLGASPAEYLDYRDRTRAFSEIAGYEGAEFDLTNDREPLRVQAGRVTHTLFSTLGVSPLAGRTFYAAEDQPGDRVLDLFGPCGQLARRGAVLGRELPSCESAGR
jgi:hypothetical protein